MSALLKITAILRLASVRATTVRKFSTSSPSAYAIEKKALGKKITMPKDPYLLSEKVVKFARNGKLDEAITLVLEAPKSRQNEVVWNHLIQESSKLGKTNQSWQLLSDMKKRGLEPSDRTFTILLNALAINSSSPNSVSRAQTLYQQMRDSEDTPPTLTHTNALLKVCARKPDLEALQQVYESMPKSGPDSPDVVTFNILINSFARMGGDKGFEMAWKIWDDCLEAKTRRPEDINLDEGVVDAILLACREAKSSAFIKRGYRLVESLYGLTLSSSNPESNARVAGTTTLERAISPSKALGLGPLLKRDTIQPRTVELLLSICVKLKDHGKAQQYMDLVRKTYPDFKPDPQLLATLMHLQVSVKEYEKAIQTWDEINVLGLQHTPATFKQGLDASLKARNWDKTLEMYTEMKNLIKKNKSIDTTFHRPLNPVVHQQDAWTLASTLKCAVKTKHIADAVQILRESHWTRVVQNPRYSRANADVAELATKIYTAALKSTKTLVDAGTTTAQESKCTQADKEELERQLREAKELHARLAETLAKHDEAKAQKESEEREAFRSRRAQRPFFGTTRRNVPGAEAESGSGWREVSHSDWRDVSDNDGRESFRGGGNAGFERKNIRGQDVDSSNLSRSGRASRENGTRRVQPALRPSRTFTRDFS